MQSAKDGGSLKQMPVPTFGVLFGVHIATEQDVVFALCQPQRILKHTHGMSVVLSIVVPISKGRIKHESSKIHSDYRTRSDRRRSG